MPCQAATATAQAPLVVYKPVAEPRATTRSAALDARARGATVQTSAGDIRSRWPFGDLLVRPGARLGILRREGGSWVPARGAPSPRAGMLRAGSFEDLALGKLARLASPEAEAKGVASVPFQDTLRIAVLRVDFLTDRSGDSTTGNGHFDVSPPDTINLPVDPTPHNRAFYESHMEALRRYYATATNGRLVLEWEVFPQADSAYHSGDMADFGPWRLTPDIFDVAYRMVRGLFAAADTQDTSIPWERFDRVVIFHAGSDLQSDVKLDSPNDLPTFTIGLDDSLAIPVGDSTKIFTAAILPETANQDGYFAALNAVNAHENGHNLFGWRDVYDVFSGLPVCGEFTLMDTGNLVGTTLQVGDSANARQFFAIGVLPPLADPYQRHLVWDDVPRTELPIYGTVDSLVPPQISGRALKVPLDSEEYLLLENRQDDLNGDRRLILVRDPDTRVILGPGSADSLEYDFLLPGPGIVIWQVDESVVAFDPPGRRSDFFYTINANPSRLGLQIIEADALDDLGDFTSPFALGSPLDPWFVPNNGRLARDTRPPLVTNSGTDPHVAIDVLDSLRVTMHVRVSRDWQLAGWPVKVKPPKQGIEPLAIPGGVDLAACPPPGFGQAVSLIAFTARDSAIHAFCSNGSPGGPTGEILWKAPASLSPIAELDDPVQGALIASVYPDPESLSDTTWSTGGSWVVLVGPSGAVTPGFPLRIPNGSSGQPDWITAGPLVADLDGSGGSPPGVFVGTRDGRVYRIGADASVSRLDEWTPLEGTAPATNVPILALTASPGAQPVAFLAEADSLGNVAVSPAPGAMAGPRSVGRPGWQPLLAFIQLNRGVDGRQIGVGTDPVPPNTPSPPQLVILDRASGAGEIFGLSSPPGRLAELRGVDAPLAKGIAAGDLDGDGFNEIVIATRDGRIGFWNLSGGATPGWPKDVEPEPFATQASPLVAQLDGTAGLEIVAATGSGRIFALDSRKKPLSGWPLGTGAGQAGSPALLDVDGDGDLEMLVADADSSLYAFDLPSAPASAAVWPLWGHDAGRTFSLVDPPTTGSLPDGGLLVAGSLRCYPNPAKRSPVTVAFQLKEPSLVTLTVYDPSGRRVAEMEQAGLKSDNALVWKADGQAPGLYLGSLRIEAGGSSESHLVHIGLLR